MNLVKDRNWLNVLLKNVEKQRSVKEIKMSSSKTHQRNKCAQTTGPRK